MRIPVIPSASTGSSGCPPAQQLQQLGAHGFQLLAQQGEAVRRARPYRSTGWRAPAAHRRRFAFCPPDREGGGLEAELPFGHQLQTMFGRGIPQVIGQQCVDHDALQGNAMPQQDQAVVFGVL